MKFWDLLDISKFLKVLSLKSFDNSWGILYILCFLRIITIRFTCGDTKILANIKMSQNILTRIVGLPKMKVFWNKDYGIIIYVLDVASKVLSPDSNHIVGAIMWSKFGNFSVSMREVTITAISYEFDRKKNFLWGVILIQVQ